MLIFGKSPSPVDIRDIVSPFLFFSKKTSSSVISLHSTLFKHWSIWKFFWRRWTDPNYVNFLNVSVYKVETVWVIVKDNLMHIGLYFLSFSWFNFESFSSLAWACRSKIVVLFCQESCRSDSFCFWLFVLMLIGKV